MPNSLVLCLLEQHPAEWGGRRAEGPPHGQTESQHTSFFNVMNVLNRLSVLHKWSTMVKLRAGRQRHFRIEPGLRQCSVCSVSCFS